MARKFLDFVDGTTKMAGWKPKKLQRKGDVPMMMLALTWMKATLTGSGEIRQEILDSMVKMAE